MKIKVLCLLLCFLLILNLAACAGYNQIMYKHLCDEKNYGTYTVTLRNIYVCHRETGKLEVYDPAVHDENYLSETVYLGVSKLDGFYGEKAYLEDGTLTEALVWLEVPPENSKILLRSGFYTAVSPGEVLEIRASNWVYMDGNFYYVIGLQYGETAYLSSEDGLKNIIDMMDKNRSFF